MSQILVFKNSLLSELNVKQAITRIEDRPDLIPAILKNENLGFMERKFAELDPNYRQIIPYCVLKKGDLYFSYERTKKGAESRLHCLSSIGIGGHVDFGIDGEGVEAFKAAFIRELQEEVNLVGDYESKILGVITSSQSPVDSVHCGIVYLVNLLEDAKLEFRDASLDKGTFLTYTGLCERFASFEGWSQLVIKDLLQ